MPEPECFRFECSLWSILRALLATLFLGSVSFPSVTSFDLRLIPLVFLLLFLFFFLRLMLLIFPRLFSFSSYSSFSSSSSSASFFFHSRAFSRGGAEVERLRCPVITPVLCSSVSVACSLSKSFFCVSTPSYKRPLLRLPNPRLGYLFDFPFFAQIPFRAIIRLL